MANNEGDQQFSEFSWALLLSRLSAGELWLKYFAMGGSVGQLELEAYLYASFSLPALDRDLVAQVLNEQFMVLPTGVRIPYSTDREDPDS